jgi:hypothetical protein
MRHFIVKMISTSTEKEEEHEGELMGTDVGRGFIDFARAERGQGGLRFARPSRQIDPYKGRNL